MVLPLAYPSLYSSGINIRTVKTPFLSAAVSGYREHVYPRLVGALGNPEPIRKIREQIIPWAQGIVLEIGVGPGVNFGHYDAQKVRKIYALEPNKGMIRLAARQKGWTNLEIEFIDLRAEEIPLADESIDTVVSTFTLCTIPAVAEAIVGIGRVLKPDGKFIFFEHGISPEPRVQRWQRFWEPILYRVFNGCHVTRDIPRLLTRSGFTIEKIEMNYLTPFPRSLAYCWWGTAMRCRPTGNDHSAGLPRIHVSNG